jgi:YVTN family beta-propeller protein
MMGKGLRGAGTGGSALSAILLVLVVTSTLSIAPHLGVADPGSRSASVGALPHARAADPPPLSPLEAPGPAEGPRAGSARTAVTPSPGLTIGAIGVGSEPLGIVYDPKDGYDYVANHAGDTVTILNATSVVATVGVSGSPEAGTYDPATGDVYISSGNSVIELNGTYYGGSVTAGGSQPWGGAYDPLDQEMYIPNYLSDNLTILKGLTPAGSIALPTGARPVAVAFDPADSDLYVSDYGAAAVTVINANKVLGSLPVGMLPGDLVYDAADQEVYVASEGSDNITLISGTTDAGTIALAYPVWGMAYDLQNGYVYATNSGASGTNVTVVRGGSVIAQIPTGVNPLGADYDATNGLVYVSSAGADAVTAISTVLTVQPLTATPSGSPANSTDIGSAVMLSMPVTGNTSWRYDPQAVASPSTFGCAAPALSLNGATDTLVSGTLSVTCTPSAPGNYSVNVTLDATGRLALSSSIDFTVFPTLSLGAPVPSNWYVKGQLHTDVGVRTLWTVPYQGGSGAFQGFTWNGFPFGDCTGLTSEQPTCSFSKTGAFAVSVTATDSNGATATSPSSAFSVSNPPTVSTPSSNRTTADIGQPVGFNTTAMGGSGGYIFHWLGVPASCATTLVPFLSCAQVTLGGSANTSFFDVSVFVTDSNGGNSTVSQPADVVIFPDPNVPAPVVAPAQVSTGELFTLTIDVSGGPGNGNYNLTWHGLPYGECSYSGLPVNSTANCRTGEPGGYEVFVTCVDADDFAIDSPKTLVTVTGPYLDLNTTPPPNNTPALFLGLPAAEGYAVLGVALVAIAVLLTVLALRSRRGGGGEEGTTTEEEGYDGESEGAENPPDEEEPLDEANPPEDEEPPPDESIGAGPEEPDSGSLDDLAYFEDESR